METTQAKPEVAKFGVHTFYSWGECIDAAKNGAAKTPSYNSSQEVSSSPNPWEGTKTFGEAMELATNGWTAGEETIGKISAKVLAKVTSLIQRDEVVYDVEGIGLDVAEYLNGVPECWQRFESHMAEGEGIKHIRLVYNATASAGIEPNIMAARGAAVAALVQALEYAGARVEVWAIPIAIRCGWGGSGKGPDFEARVLVKAADQDLDMSRVAYALAQPSMLRRIGFALLEGHEGAMKAAGYSYGHPATTLDKGDVYIDSARLGEAQWTKEESAVQWVLAELQKQGIQLTAQ